MMPEVPQGCHQSHPCSRLAGGSSGTAGAAGVTSGTQRILVTLKLGACERGCTEAA